MIVSAGETMLRNVELSAAIANIWFVAWAIRHKGELDHELDRTAKLIRWLVAIVCLGVVAQFPQSLNPPPFRVCVAFVGIGFLVWPNFAFYFTRLLRRLRILSQAAAKSLDDPDLPQ
jgi:hypothetical protein